MRPKSKRPHTIHYLVPDVVVGIIFTLQRLFGWGGHRIAAELKGREIVQPGTSPALLLTLPKPRL